MNTVMTERIQDYSYFLDRFEIPYRPSGSYYYVGYIEQTQGWIIHISIVVSQAGALLKKILPVLNRCNCAFKIVKDRPTLMAINAGDEGYNRIGKIICIYPENDETALLIYTKLLPLTSEFKGPAVLTDYHLGAILYTRYGTYNAANLNVEYGQPYTMVTDGNGNSYYDYYPFFPITPEGNQNPFRQFILPAKYASKSKLLNNKYVIQKTISMSVKGNVLLARMNNGLFSKKCIIKQGRENMLADDTGRNIADRLRWQFEIGKRLEYILPIPKVYEYFELEGDSYFSMEYISGIPLNHYIIGRYERSLWPFLSLSARKQLLYVMQQLITTIKKLHHLGYIHRDINSNNFIVRKHHKVCMIDLELTYSSLTHLPEPPFESATFGYSSAEQMALIVPTPEDDIYSTGALLIMFFTGLEPMFIIEKDISHLEEKLIFLTGSQEITELILRCLTVTPSLRPSLYHVLSRIDKIATDNRLIKQRAPTTIQRPVLKMIDQTIWEALNGFLNSYLLSEDGLWVSGLNTHSPVHGNSNIQVLPGLDRGIAGVLYLLSKARICGCDIYHLHDLVKKGYEYCLDLALPQMLTMQGAFHSGKEGIALMMAYVEKAGIMDSDSTLSLRIAQCFDIYGEGLNIKNGIAGKGLALIQCKHFLEEGTYLTILDHYALEIINNQEEDGSWTCENDEGRPEKLTGFDYGIAGIIYFLMEYCMESVNERAWLAISTGLGYLEKQAVKRGDAYQWYVSDINKTIAEYWGTGVPGIALCFLSAFRQTGISRYKTIAIKALNFHPPVFVHYNLSLANGIAGLGEIYLEAYTILQSEIYLERANWIADLLIHLKIKTSYKNCTWYAENNYYPSPDLLTGCSGIIHFLLRYRYNGKLSLPLMI